MVFDLTPTKGINELGRESLGAVQCYLSGSGEGSYVQQWAQPR